jgi:para-aminobenzoate synthetase / 4-amino-4-deoxychorismate lyase
MKALFEFEKRPLFFEEPETIISCNEGASLKGCFEEIEKALAAGYYVAGFFSYEAGYAFEEKLRQVKAYDFPLVCMGVFKAPIRGRAAVERSSFKEELKDLHLNISQEDYSRDIARIRDFIAKGDVYQITYCIKLLFKYSADPFSLYSLLLRQQPVPYPAYVETERFSILSLSPEMFIKKDTTAVVTKPMKGTWPRGGNPLFDLFERVRFQFDSKNRAENVMIADLLRNDLGRIGVRIKAPRLFEVARYKTLFQMTSTVTGQVDKDASVYGLFASLFPSGSVTGAPKIRAMEIIRGLEKEERKIYTGAIGYITPDKDMFFNIPIRTILMEGEKAEMGIGGGIVWDSTSLGEWKEGLLKAQFVTLNQRIHA